MRVEDCFYLGQIRKPHGILGEVKAFFDVDFIEDYEEKESVYILQGSKLTPFFIANFRTIGPNLAILQFEGVNTREAAEQLAGSEFYIPETEVPPLREGQFYYHQIIGYQVVDNDLGPLGTVRSVVEMPGHDIVEMNYQGKVVLIPLSPVIVISADHVNRTLQTQLPEGLLDVYIKPGTPEPDEED